MKTRYDWQVVKSAKSFFSVAAIFGIAFSVCGTVLIDEQFESGYNRTTNNIAGSNLSMLKARSGTTATVNVGSLTFSPASNTGADQYWSYFTDVGANIGGIGTASAVNNGHLDLGIGDELIVSLNFRLGTVPANFSSYALRFGVLDQSSGRQTADLNGGGNSTQWTSDTCFAVFVPLASVGGTNDIISIRRRTTFTTGNIFSSQADFTQIGDAVGGAYNPLTANTNYTFKFTIARPDASTWRLTAAIVDTVSSSVLNSGMVTTNAGLTSFNWFAWRYPSNVVATTFTRLKVEVTNATVVVSDPFALWQTAYFGSPGNPQAAGTADPDGDGLINTNEFLAGFNPLNSSAFAHVKNIGTNGQDGVITYLGSNGDSTWSPGVASRTNVLEATIGAPGGSYLNNYVSTGLTNILSGGTGVGIVTNFVDVGGATNSPSRYYRGRVLTP